MKHSGIENVALIAPFAFLIVLWLSPMMLLLGMVFAVPLVLMASMRLTRTVPTRDFVVHVPDYVPDYFTE